MRVSTLCVIITETAVSFKLNVSIQLFDMTEYEFDQNHPPQTRRYIYGIKIPLYVKKIIETGSYLNASKALNYAQSTITFQVKQLEAELDVQIFLLSQFCVHYCSASS